MLLLLRSSLRSAALLRNLSAHLLDGTTVEAGVDRSCRSKAAVLAQKQRENCATLLLLTYPAFQASYVSEPIIAVLASTICYVLFAIANYIDAEKTLCLFFYG
jgi:hypothetical protein